MTKTVSESVSKVSESDSSLSPPRGEGRGEGCSQLPAHWLTHLLTYGLLLLHTGCTVTRITTGHWSICRVSFLQRLEIPEVEFGTNGTATLRGYKSDGGNQAAAAITAAAVTAAIKSAK